MTFQHICPKYDVEMVFRKFRKAAKAFMPVLGGLCIGLALSVVLVPLVDEECSSTDSVLAAGRSHRTQTNTQHQEDSFDYGGDDFEPRIKSPANKVANSEKNPSSPKRILRPRYISTELGIREKLFVGVLTSKLTIDTYGIAVNKTLAQYVPKLVFFMDTRGPTLPGGLSVVSFSDEKPNLRPFHMLKYIGSHYAQAFDYYYFVVDKVYVKGEKLFDLVSKLSISLDIHLGRRIQSGAHCDLGSGILLSQHLLMRVLENLDWCTKHALSEDMSENVGNCFVHATGQNCCSKVNGKEYSSYSSSFSFSGNFPQAQGEEGFKNALTIPGVDSDVTIYKLHRYFCEQDLITTKEELEKLKQDIVEMGPLTPEGNASLTWPIGVDPPSKPKTRFDILRWDFFTDTHIYFDDDFTNYRELIGVHKQDVEEVVKISLQKLNLKYNNKYELVKLQSGYRRFDPVRGMEYKVDLLLRDKVKDVQVTKRCNLMRPLGQVEIVPMPYVTESTRVNLILPVTVSNRDGVVSFLDSYAHTCLDSGDNANLFVVFVYDTVDYKHSKDDIFSVLKSMISYYESKYMNGARIAWTAIQNSNPTQLVIMDTISRKFPPESLLLLCTVGMELSIEFLNRVRMNTIAGWQAYFPIAFWQYKPNLIYEEKPYPTTVEVKKDVGHFDSKAYEHASFYNSDYMHARKAMIAAKRAGEIDLFDLFLGYHSVHVFRAVEPALLHRYRDRPCTPSQDEDAYHRCLEIRAHGLASRSQLAMLIFEHQQKLDQGHMDVIHKQNDPNVEQMKPNMLRK